MEGLIGAGVGLFVAVIGALFGGRAVSGLFKGAKGISYRSLAESSANAVQTLEAAYNVTKAEVASLQAQVSDLREENKTLRELVTSAAAVESLRKMVESNHKELMEAVAHG